MEWSTWSWPASPRKRGQTSQALRYYHNAIYAVWPSDEEGRRRDTRLELIEYLLSINATKQAQAELIALEENLGDDPSLQQHAGDLFLRAQDYEHALGAYRVSLKSHPRNQKAMAGAGFAAFQLGRYPLAEHYLQEAAAADSSDTRSASLLKTTDLVLRMDPFRRQVSAVERSEIVREAFDAAGQRLTACGSAKLPVPADASQPSLADRWQKMKPQISEGALRRNPDLIENAMDLVFAIERQTSATCGPPTGADLALLLIAKLHEGNQSGLGSEF